MLTMFATFLNYLRGPSQAERELAYLNGAQDRYDLESREREIDRGMFRDKTLSLLSH